MTKAIPAPPGSTTTIRRDGKDGKMHVCTVQGCGASFKKLEHAQRHERTHTQVRPYACSHCGKTFARQDTLNRHVRLHTRKEEDGPTAKAGRKIKKGTSVSPASKPIELKPASLPPPASPPKTSTSLPYPFSMPIMPPNFPAYSRPYVGEASLPLDQTFMPMRRYSDVSYGATLLSLNPPMSRPRANTLAGLPEALGSISLVNSPESSGALDSGSSSDEEDDEKDKTYSPDEKDLPESQYPSPAFTTYSPNDLQRDTLTDLEAILANDPLHSNNSSLFLPSVQPQEDGFDFESFAASVEGPPPGSTLEDLLNAAVPPTPPSAHLKHPMLPHHQPQTHLDFDFSATFAAADRQRREQQQNQVQTATPASITMPAFSIPATAGTLPAPTSLNPSQSQQSPHLTFPTTSNTSYPTSAFASAYSTSYPSLMALPNGLGLTQNAEPHQALLDAYRKRSAPPAPPSAPAFYIPSTSETATSPVLAAAPSSTPAARFHLPVPTWSSAARDGAERGETSSFLVV
ncbi:hypothetical protein BCR35DRAFT_300630 [Leucosporidium creatinivorum]|uniref:C2H2-type domain-containing protein n=1 Tax=Leucosporidium creatinivorum TaxID=106004 RepID=A0A1Y2FZ77_9BASI|nr:hypothetical protein BCR35DRAFT_300630 [Leucosporidium creatinivorum]